MIHTNIVSNVHTLRFLLSLDSIDIQGQDMISPCMTIPVYNVVFDWKQTTLGFLRSLQNDLAQVANHSLLALREIPVPDIASLFQTVLDFWPLSTSKDNLHSQPPPTDNVDHDLTFSINSIGSEEIEVEAQFASARISEPETNIFLDHFGTALESILQNLTGSLGDVNLVNSEEKRRIVVGLNATHPFGTMLSSANNVTELIEEQARKTSQRMAVRQESTVKRLSLIIFVR